MAQIVAKRIRRASLKDVAELAGISVSTVSRVISGKGYVSEKVRSAVQAAAKQLNYQPNLRARSLRQRSSGGIGLIIPNLLNVYYTAMAHSISKLLAARGYYLLLAETDNDPETEGEVLQAMVGQAVDGLLWVPTAPDQERIGYLVDMHIPVVSLVRRVPGDTVDTVVFEDFAGSVAATQHLIDLGHERIAFIGGDVEFSSNRLRWEGFEHTMRRAGLPHSRELLKLGTIRDTFGSAAVSELLRLPAPPTAIFVASNPIMSGVIRMLRQHGVHPPQQMSLVCFDDVDWFSFSTPPITAVRVAHTRLAETAVDMLVRRIDEADRPEPPPNLVEIYCELVMRRSSAPPRTEPLVLNGDFSV
jgi:LacI family transcriptional regulator